MGLFIIITIYKFLLCQEEQIIDSNIPQTELMRRQQGVEARPKQVVLMAQPRDSPKTAEDEYQITAECFHAVSVTAKYVSASAFQEAKNPAPTLHHNAAPHTFWRSGIKITQHNYPYDHTSKRKSSH